VCVSDPQQSVAIMALLAECVDFEVIAAANAPEEAVEFSRTLSPDMLIIDDPLTDGRGIEIANELLLERAMPTMLMADKFTAPIPAWLKKAGISVLSRDIVRSDQENTRAHVRTRLQLLGARCCQRRRTQTAGTLHEALTRLRARTHGIEVSPELRALYEKPLDLMVLMGGEGSCQRFRDLLAIAGHPRIPILAAIADPRIDSPVTGLADSNKLASRVENTVALRDLNGLWALGPTEHVEYVEGLLQYDENSENGLDLDRLAQSLGALGEHCLIVMLGGNTAQCVNGLRQAVRDGVRLAVINPEDAPGESMQCARILIEARLATAQITTEDLAAVMRNVIPRRT